MSDCPICYAPMKTEVSTGDWGGPIVEEYETCPNGCYAYEYAYGETKVHVSIRDHHIEFGWYHSDDPAMIKAETEAVNTACDAARRARLEDLSEDKTERSKEQS